MSNVYEESLKLHKENQGKLAIAPKVTVATAADLSLAYSPGVAEPCREIHKNEETIYDYTMKGNMVAVVSNGTAVLGLGNIGPEAALPVMEGKSILLKSFAGVDSFPICLKTETPDELIQACKWIEPNFGAINLEDIAAPHCFYIEDALKEQLKIPVFHDDQHGTAIVVLAGLKNAMKIVNKKLEDCKIVLNGAGAAGTAILKLLHLYGVRNMIMCDTKGAIYEGRPEGMNSLKEEIAELTNREKISGSLEDVLVDADVFIGVSVAGVLTKDMVQKMNNDPIIFALANPTPEIMPEEAKAVGATVIGTGRSDYPNQVNNVLAFPGIFRGALEVRATQINEEMKVAAVEAIASLVSEEDLNADYVIPSPFDPRVAPIVAAQVAKAAMETGVARIQVDIEKVAEKTRALASIDK